MESTLNRDNPEVRLRAFRAIDDPETCDKFIEGHTHVLTSIGVTKVTSSKNEWKDNPGSFVLIVESLDREKVYGGARVHVSGGSQPLPIEQATGAMDKSVFDLVWQYAQYGTGELCGLWNSREIAGYGVGSIFLSRACVAIAPQIGLTSLFALGAPYTVQMALNIGYEIEKSIGNDGTFYYPKLDLLATTLILKDLNNLSKATVEDRDAIFSIRNQQNLVRVENLRKKEITIHYETKIQGLERWSLADTIENAKNNYKNIHFDDVNINLF